MLVATSLNVSGDSALSGRLNIRGEGTFDGHVTVNGPLGILVSMGKAEKVPAYNALQAIIAGAVDYAQTAFIADTDARMALYCASSRSELGYPTVKIENTARDGNGTALWLTGVLRGDSDGAAVRIGGYSGVYRLQNDRDKIQIFNVNTGVAKTFIIEHPQDEQKYLVHATLEGPEAAVFYRGSRRAGGGHAEIELPAYFEALTDPDSVTVQLTPIDGFDRLCVQTVAGRKVHEGRFRVVSSNATSTQAFDWEVKGMRRAAARRRAGQARHLGSRFRLLPLSHARRGTVNRLRRVGREWRARRGLRLPALAVTAVADVASPIA